MKFAKLSPSRALGEVVLWSAFLASGGHVFQVARDMGNAAPIAFVHAVGLDGLVYVGINACRDGAWVRGVISVVYGGGMSLAFNWASYSATGRLPAWIIAMSMPVSLILSVVAGHATSGKAKVEPAGTTPVVPEIVPEIVPVSRPREQTPRPAPAPVQPPAAAPRSHVPAPPAKPAASAPAKPKPAVTSSDDRPPIDRDAIAADILAGKLQVKAVAAEHGVTERAVQGWVKKRRDAAEQPAPSAPPLPIEPPAPLPGKGNGHHFSQVKAGEN